MRVTAWRWASTLSEIGYFRSPGVVNSDIGKPVGTAADIKKAMCGELTKYSHGYEANVNSSAMVPLLGFFSWLRMLSFVP